MGEVSKTVGQWIVNNLGWSVILVLFLFSLFFEFSKIKLNPISALFKRIGNAFTSGIKQDIADLKEDTNQKIADLEKKTSKELKEIKDSSMANCKAMKEKLAELEEQTDLQSAARIKSHVFNFAKECYRKEKHTKKDFANLFEENRQYEELVKKYNWKNDCYTEDYAYIKHVYRQCLENNDFQSTEI